MITRYFALDDVSSAQYGISLQKCPSFDAAKPVIEKVTVPSRNGDLIFYSGAYENVSGALDCFILHEQTYDALAEANGWLSKQGYRKLTYDGDAEAYRMARIVNLGEFSVRMMRLDPFTIDLDCKPQRFLNSGDVPMVFLASDYFDCPAVSGLPLLRIYGTSGTVRINDKTIMLNTINEYVDIDCELQNAAKGNVNCNSNISCLDFPKLNSGKNEIAFSSGISKVEMTPRWYTL